MLDAGERVRCRGVQKNAAKDLQRSKKRPAGCGQQALVLSVTGKRGERGGGGVKG